MPCPFIVPMQRLLKEIAHIQPGHPFRERIEPVEHGDLRVIQIKDIGADGSIIENEIVSVNADNVKQTFFVRSGDVLFTTRGVSRRATAVTKEMLATIFVAQIFAIRDLDQSILPEYLAWFLEQLPAQDYFDTYSSGTTIQNIRKDVLAGLPVDIPSIETQKKVLKISELRRREIALKKIIELRRDILINDALLSAIRT